MPADLTHQQPSPPGKAFRDFLVLAGWLALCFVVAGLGGAATSTSVSTWYLELEKPSWNPPSWVFGPVWTVLYAMMAVAAWLVWRVPPSTERSAGLRVFGVQLALNLLWSCVFFGLRNPGWAFLEVVLMWTAIAVTMRCFLRLSRPAGWLLAPYLAWTTFAATLNFTLWMLNR